MKITIFDKDTCDKINEVIYGIPVQNIALEEFGVYGKTFLAYQCEESGFLVKTEKGFALVPTYFIKENSL